MVEPNNVEALANCLTLLLGDPQRRRQYGAGGRERVEEEFTWRHVASRMYPYLRQAVYERIANQAC